MELSADSQHRKICGGFWMCFAYIYMKSTFVQAMFSDLLVMYDLLTAELHKKL